MNYGFIFETHCIHIFMYIASKLFCTYSCMTWISTPFWRFSDDWWWLKFSLAYRFTPSLPGSHFSLSSYVVSSFVSCFYLTLLSLLPKNLITNMNSRKCHIVRHCSQKFHTLNWLFILDIALVVTHTNIDAITAPSKFIMVLEACQSWPYPEQYASLLRKKPSADTEVLI